MFVVRRGHLWWNKVFFATRYHKYSISYLLNLIFLILTWWFLKYLSIKTSTPSPGCQICDSGTKNREPLWECHQIWRDLLITPLWPLLIASGGKVSKFPKLLWFIIPLSPKGKISLSPILGVPFSFFSPSRWDMALIVLHLFDHKPFKMEYYGWNS